MNAPLDSTPRGHRVKVTEAEMRLNATELRKLPPERRNAILREHAHQAASEYLNDPGSIIEGGSELIDD